MRKKLIETKLKNCSLICWFDDRNVILTNDWPDLHINYYFCVLRNLTNQVTWIITIHSG